MFETFKETPFSVGNILRVLAFEEEAELDFIAISEMTILVGRGSPKRNITFRSRHSRSHVIIVFMIAVMKVLHCEPTFLQRYVAHCGSIYPRKAKDTGKSEH